MPQDAPQHQQSAPLLTARDVSVTFRGARLFERVELTLAPEEMVVVVGRNGSGKTTLLRAIAGLQPHTGAIVHRGDDDASQSTRRLAASMSRGVLMGPFLLVFASIVALFASNVAYNFFDYMRLEGNCDPNDALTVRCEEGFFRSAAGFLGEGVAHDVTAFAYNVFYLERFDWSAMLQISVILGGAMALVSLALLGVWYVAQGPVHRARFRREATRKVIDLTLVAAPVTLLLFLLVPKIAIAPVMLYFAFLPMQLTDAATPNGLRIAYIPQRLGIIERATVLENVLHGLLRERHGLARLRSLLGIWTSEERQEAIEALELTGVPHLVERRVESLSGGERRRVTMARALVQRADLLLADEFLSEVDRATADRLVHSIRDLCKARGTAVLFVEHNLELAHAHADRGFQLTHTGLEVWEGGALE